MEEDTTTTTGAEDTQAQEIEQPETQETQAVQSEESSNEQTEETTETNESEVDLDEWVSKKGIDVENVDKKALLKMVFNSEKKMHEATQEAKQAVELQSAVSTINEENYVDEQTALMNELRVDRFFMRNPNALAYEELMAKIGKEEKPHLLQSMDFDTLYELAKARSSAVNEVQIRQTGQKEALAQVAKAEAAAPPQTSATTKQGVKQISDEDIANMSLDEYREYKKNTNFNPFA